MRLITDNIYRITAAVGRVPQAPLVIEARSVDDADNMVLQYFAQQATDEAKEVRIIAVEVILLQVE